MTLNQVKLSAMFRAAGELLQRENGRLSEIDSRFGDGDHGVTMNKIGALLCQEADNWQAASIHDFIEDVGVKIMAIGGGSAGPLYGTLIGGLAEALSGDEQEISPSQLKDMLSASLAEMCDITTAHKGDKTMMDALIPAVEAAREAPDEIPAILEAAKAAAAKGAADSEQYVAKFGRAKSYKDQTIGTPDAGAVSTSLFFAGLADGL